MAHVNKNYCTHVRTLSRCMVLALNCIALTDALIVWGGKTLAHDKIESSRNRGACRQRPLVPRSSKFKVLQLADIHLGEKGCDSDQDKKTFRAIDVLLQDEDPDLVVLSGDQLTGEHLSSDNDRKCLIDKLHAKLNEHNVRWATVFGNHDACDQPGCKPISNFALRSVKSSAQAFPTKTEVNDAHQELGKAFAKHARNIIYGKTSSTSAPAHVTQSVLGTGPPTQTPTTPAPQGGGAGNANLVKNQNNSNNSKPNMLVLSRLQPRLRSHGDVSQQPMPKNVLQQASVGTSNSLRKTLLRFEQAADCSLTGVDGIFESAGGGVTNYRLKLFKTAADAKKDTPSFILWFLDTGGGQQPEQLHKDQLDWMVNESKSLRSRYGPLPGALYMHIPMQEFTHTGPKSSKCTGKADDHVSPVSGLSVFPILADMNVSWIFAGHNHGNDWCCSVQATGNHVSSRPAAAKNIQICYGRHSGYGGYSTPSIHRVGARIFEIDPFMAKKYLKGQASDSTGYSYVLPLRGSAKARTNSSGPSKV